MNPIALAVLALLDKLLPVVVDRLDKIKGGPPTDPQTLEQLKTELHADVAAGLSEIVEARAHQNKG